MDGLPCIGRGIWLVRAELFSFHFADTQLVFFLQSSTLLDEYGNGIVDSKRMGQQYCKMVHIWNALSRSSVIGAAVYINISV